MIKKVLENSRNIHNCNVKTVHDNVNCLWAVSSRYRSRQCTI